jgi:hypothetical protein
MLSQKLPTKVEGDFAGVYLSFIQKVQSLDQSKRERERTQVYKVVVSPTCYYLKRSVNTMSGHIIVLGYVQPELMKMFSKQKILCSTINYF